MAFLLLIRWSKEPRLEEYLHSNDPEAREPVPVAAMSTEIIGHSVLNRLKLFTIKITNGELDYTMSVAQAD